MYYVISTVIACLNALNGRVQPTYACSNSFSAVRDLQSIRFEAFRVDTGNFSVGSFKGATLTSVHACVSGGSQLPLSALLAVEQIACTLLEHYLDYRIYNGGHVTDLKDLIG